MDLHQCEAAGFNDEIKAVLASWGIQNLTDIQCIALNNGISNEQSLLVSAPTSSGKTLVGEIALLAALKKSKKCLYLVSHKALADQKYNDFEERFGVSGLNNIATVGLSTGDRQEGEIRPELLVATYEKALALALSGMIDFTNLLVVADELQIIGEDGRGANIEALCSIIRQQNIYQFVALTATVGNPEELADWLQCKLAVSYKRDIELYQEIWSGNQIYTVRFGDDIGSTYENGSLLPTDVIGVTSKLVEDGKGPVLVFTESRGEALRFANQYSQQIQQNAQGIELSEQLDLFSEPTEASEQLLGTARKGVAFHSADLTAQERQVIEDGIVNSKIQVCFATSTLAAGVNFPFKTVVFPKISYQWRPDPRIKKSDYRNMSGRAGRLGMHDQGFSILLPKNPVELRHVNDIVLPENERVNSKLSSISMRKTVLMLVSSKIIETEEQIRDYFENTYFWHQVSEHNPAKLDDILNKASSAITWLHNNNLIVKENISLMITPLGKAVSETGLLPSTALNFLSDMAKFSDPIEKNFEEFVTGIVHWICQSPEFNGEGKTRFLPYPVGNQPVQSNDFLASKTLISNLDRTQSQLNQCAHAIVLFCSGLEERKIKFQTNMSSGSVHRTAIDVSWVLDGLQRVLCVPELGYSQALTNNLSMLSKRIKWGTTAEALDLITVAQKNNVPGFGRQRALAVIKSGLITFEDIIAAPIATLISVVRNSERADALRTAISGTIGFDVKRYEKTHIQVASELGLGELVKLCYSEFGTKYEEKIKQLLEAESSLIVRTLDDGKQQNVPDLMISLNNTHVLLECKTAIKKPPLVNKEDAWAVIQKSADYDDSMKRVTLAKPGFDITSKTKVVAAKDISLIEHSTFIEGALRLLSGNIDSQQFINWLTEPGLIEVERLAGNKTYEIAQG